MKLSLIANLLTFLLITILTGLVSFLCKISGLAPSDALVLWIVSLIVLLGLFYGSREKIWALLTARLVDHVIKKFGVKIGLTKVYDNFDTAAPAIKKAFDQAHDVRIFIQLGRGIVGGSKSLLFKAAQEKKSRGFQMKLLYADVNSTHLSPKQASSRGSNYKEWTSAIDYTEGSIAALLEDGIQVEARQHTEPYLWRLFLFDKTLFFVPYLTDKDNGAQAATFEFTLDDKNSLSLYIPFSRYFDQIWESQESRAYGMKPQYSPQASPRSTDKSMV